MPLAVFPSVSLSAVSAVVPRRCVRIEDELHYFDGSREKAEKAAALSGVFSRRIADEDVTASDLCRQAAQRLFSVLPEAREAIDVVVFMSQSPDYLLPATASVLQGSLGLPSDCAAMDMNSGCAGFVHGLWVLGGLVASGACHKALLLVGDTTARFLNPDNRVTAPLFGDGGAAALIERCATGPGASFLVGNDGKNGEALIIPGGGSRLPQSRSEGPDAPFNRTVVDAMGNPWTLGDYGQLWMNGMAVFSFGVGVVPSHIREHLALAGITAAEVDALFLHQANKLMIQTIAKKVGVGPDKTPTTVLERYGNLGAASLPALICETLHAAKAEQRPEKALLCGFGAGLSWSSCLLSLRETRVLPVAEYEEREGALSRDERIAYWHDKYAGGGR